MSYLLSGKVQTCYFNNVFCKIKIFEYLETGRYEDYRPRPGLKIFVKLPKNPNFQWINHLTKNRSPKYEKIRLFDESLLERLVRSYKKRFFRWIDHFSDFLSIYRKIGIFGELIIFKPNTANEAADNARYLRSLEPACKPLYAYDPLSMIEHIPNLIKVISNIYQGSCFDPPYTKPRDLYLRFQSKTARRPLKSLRFWKAPYKVNPDLICSYHP